MAKKEAARSNPDRLGASRGNIYGTPAARTAFRKPWHCGYFRRFPNTSSIRSELM